MEKARIILRYTLVTILLTLSATLIALQLPVVQTAAAGRILSFIQERVNGKVELGSVHFKFINTIVLKKLTILDGDRRPDCDAVFDTLLHCGAINVRFSLLSLMTPGCVTLKKVEILDAGFNLVIEKDGLYSTNLQRIFRIPTKETPKPMPEKEIIAIREISGTGLSYRMLNLVNKPLDFPATAINWNNLRVDDINLKASDFSITHGLFIVRLNHLDFKESSGWNLLHMEGDGQIGKGVVSVRNIVIEDHESTARIDYTMTGSTVDYRDFVNKVKMRADIKESRWSLRTLAHFIPPLNPDSTVFVAIDGLCEGRVSDLKASRLSLKTDNGIRAVLDGGVSGLPSVKEMCFDAGLRDIGATFPAVEAFVNAVAPKARLNLGKLGKGQKYGGNVSVKGNINSLKAAAHIVQVSDQGTADIDATIHNVLNSKPLTIKGKVATGSLNVGAIAGIDDPGAVSLSTRIDATIPSDDSPLMITADSLSISELVFNNYAYSEIKGRLSLFGDDLTTEISSADKALQASLTVWSDKYSYNGVAAIDFADLHKMNFDDRGKSEASMNVYAHIDKNLDFLQGNVRVSGITLTNGEGRYRIGDVLLNALNDHGRYDVSLDSDIGRGSFSGNSTNFKGELETDNCYDLAAFLFPGFYLEKGSRITASMDRDGMINGRMTSGRIALNRNFIKNLTAEVTGKADSLTARMTASDVLAAEYRFDNSILLLKRLGNVVDADYKFYNDDDDIAEGDIRAKVEFGTEPGRNTTIRTDSSTLTLGKTRWTLPPSRLTILGDDGITIEGFNMQHGGQRMTVNGKISKSETGELYADLRNVDLGQFNDIFKDTDPHLEGRLNLDAKLNSPLTGGIPDIELNLEADSLAFGGVNLGRLTGSSHPDEDRETFRLHLVDRIGDSVRLNAVAEIRPEAGEIDAGISFNSFPFDFAQVFVPDVFSEINGRVSGKVTLAGPFNGLSLRGKSIKVDSTLLKVSFTHVPYFADGTLDIDDNGIHIVRMDVSDRFGHKAYTKGSLQWDKMRDLNLALDFDLHDIEALNIPAGIPGSVFNGNVFATGGMVIKGPFNSITMSADARTTGGSRLSITMSDALDATKGSLLAFVNPYIGHDPYELILSRYDRKRRNSSNFTFNLHAVANPSLTIGLDLGGSSFGAGMTGSGNGEADISVTPQSGFNILGDYTIQDGSFSMDVNNIVSRKFTIRNGSSIKFGGDIMQSTVNVSAVYETKASVNTLVADTTSVANRRAVECRVDILDRLANPSIKFSINVPDLEPTMKAAVESALSTEDKVQKQFLSLLLSGNFLPDEQNGIINSSSILYSNVSEIMSNQINQIFSRLDIPLDLGLNYQPTDNGTNVFDVALSTQLFNNRVIIGGTLGNRQNKGTNTSTFFGDLDIQYKVNRSGTFRIKAFSHAADQFSNFLDNSQRNGLGLTWQQEFNDFRQWFTYLSASKAEKEKIIVDESLTERKTKTVTLDE